MMTDFIHTYLELCLVYIITVAINLNSRLVPNVRDARFFSFLRRFIVVI